MQMGGATACLCIGWARNWTVWEYSWRLIVEMQHTVCCNVPICWIFWNLVSSLGSDEPCRDQGWELNCLVYITSKVHVMLFLLCIWCQYCYSSLSSSCVCAVCNWSLKMTVKCQWIVLWKWGRVLLIQIGICASYVQGILLLWAEVNSLFICPTSAQWRSVHMHMILSAQPQKVALTAVLPLCSEAEMQAALHSCSTQLLFA